MRKRVVSFAISFCTLFFITGKISAQQKKDAITEAKITALIKKMTLEEKIGMIHGNSSFTSTGVKRLGIPELTMSDGPHGVRPEHGRGWSLQNKGNDSSTYLPTGITLASTWNPKLGYSFGAVLGSEAKYRGKDVILGPGINIMRTPLNGRNFEYMSEDPYLISKMVVGYIKGVQDQGISACVKHFLANNQETKRSGINVLMSERALRELYMPGFKAAITEGNANTIMGAYNKFRGEYCTYNDYLVNRVLKGEWGFKGIMISDWGAIHTTKDALLGGADIEMGTDLDMKGDKDYNKFFFGDPALAAVKNGEVKEAVIDDKVRRILRIMFKTHMFDKRTPGEYATKAHAEVAKKVAEEGIILLKNSDNILPLKNVKSVAMIGANADRPNAFGGGSSQIRPKYEVTALAGLRKLSGGNLAISYSQGYAITRGAKADDKMIRDAAEAASKSDMAIVVGGWTHGYDYTKWSDNAYDAEGIDKPDMNMPFGQDELIKAVIKANKNTVVILYGGGPIDVSQWVNDAKAVIQVGYPGQEGGTALAEILLGKVNPSGKLTVSWPVKLEDSPAHKLGEFPGDGTDVKYNEDIYVGYRYFDTYNVKPQFAFGHGLSYTNFKYSNISTAKNHQTATVTFTLKNTGTVAGAEVAQLYVHDNHSSVKRPEKELKAFQKVFLKPGESKTITMKLNADAFKYYSETKKQWILEPGKFEVLVGTSSDAIKLKSPIIL
ncbi:glycoside hydrolase family 3 C-terminal domain-containing protein [Mucilaginibacter sp. HMF5004]|uniref:glycoside hydrolase family 3 C-terminal domain-containing protein n=1 Tax=Mucilaginibacter rivuli TaxID=2857527 RepID=UPI001C5DDE49|nr:glycoside hydrolase family 3 C-terminal domain-containing protein [Mucilaginibacter rivuli]MBW4889984.1 glycoside hydrolase family 3 C-terminal domain-containing protein [Mucilaginibacter rivuli]